MARAKQPVADGYVEKLSEEIAEDLQALPETREALSSFYVFFSFDLVNSTLYKTVNESGWPLVITKFFGAVEDGLKKRVDYAHLWKYVGDELLLYKKIETLDELRGCVPKAHAVMTHTIDRLYDLFPDSRTILSVKTTIWCARVHEIPPADIHADRPANGYRNLIVPQPVPPGREQLDFLGPDIDIGFRIARFAARRRLVISADLAYLLYKDRAENEPIENRLRIVGYERLKGVWGDRHYPVIWYEEDWNTVSSSFLYDEHHHNPIIQRLKENGESEGLAHITKILDELALKDRADELWTYVAALSPTPGAEQVAEVVQGSTSNLVEVHCVAVCFRNDGRALVARRPRDKRRFPGQWEFGCGQLSAFESFEDCLRRAYREDFGAELVIEDHPLPVSTYTIEDRAEGRHIPGIIFAVGIANPDEVKARKHIEIDWVDSQKPDLRKGDGCVPNLEETLRQAAQTWSARRAPRGRG
jgi:8-oxo-dGTP pyrophosphatase MutT (NUDIX family)